MLIHSTKNYRISPCISKLQLVLVIWDAYSVLFTYVMRRLKQRRCTLLGRTAAQT